MKRECVQKFLSGFIVFCIILSFSIFSFAAAFTGAYLYTGTDPVTGLPIVEVRGVNPTGQTFSGSNVIELNAYNNAPVLTNNTFNGSTDINPDFTDITSTGNHYNGSVDITYNGMGGTLDSNGDTFQSASVTAEQSDLSINNGTFNGTTNITANSVSLGSISQMTSLLDGLYILYYSLTRSSLVSSGVNFTVTNPWTNNSVTIQRVLITYRYFNFQPTSGGNIASPYSPSIAQVQYYGLFMDELQFLYSCIPYSITSLAYYLQYRMQILLDWIKGNGSYYIYTFSSSGETYSLTGSYQTVDFRMVIKNRLDIIVELLKWFTSRFFEWYYPLDNTLPEYWRYYNTDTADEEEIGLAGLMYNISWYLGQMYVLQSASQSLDNLQDQVDDIADTLAEAESKENAVISSISSSINSFNPDLTSIGAFRALSWSSNYLQQVFLALGTYGTVILVGLLLGVCMQFIGYFKYK